MHIRADNAHAVMPHRPNLARGETIRTMAARFHAHCAHAPAGSRALPLRYAVAARMLADNVEEHPEIARMTWAEACVDVPDSPMFRSQA